MNTTTRTRKGFSLIELVAAMGIIATISTMALDYVASAAESATSLTTLSVPESEVLAAQQYIINEGIYNSDLSVYANYTSDLNSEVEIIPTTCNNATPGHLIRIQEAGADQVLEVSTCEIGANRNYNFTTYTEAEMEAIRTAIIEA
ncbi:prepilin-type N-terminal cleavage/methylation domain-containing protein [Aliarcobacter butzleri]|uniref:type II secretion system protein n=1 Tax=Aliarcobacter butzleri TaxID=28197 RepID=UPI00344B6BEC